MNAESTQAIEANGHGAKAPTGKAATDNGAISSIAREFQNFLADLEDLIQSSTSLTGEELARARAKLHARVAAAKDSIREISSPLVDRARNTVKGADSHVHDQPWRALGIAAGASLLLGYLLGRRT
jgi:ElaB/YqjD/DUF883 family membrane-anchored ribosome-binding protein